MSGKSIIRNNASVSFLKSRPMQYLNGFSIDNMGAGRIIRKNYCVIEGSDRIGKIQLLRTCGIFAG